MSYAVVWTNDALNQLAAVWMAAADRNAVTAASNRLDRELERDPFGIGFAGNSPANRSTIDLPLGIDYEVIEDDKKVRVLRVWSVI